MSIEHLQEAEKKKLEQRSESEQKEEIRRTLEYKKEQEKLFERIDKEKKLSFLKSLVERGLIRLDTVEQMLDGTDLDSAAIADIFEKIDTILATPDVDRILPERFRVTKDEYLRALQDALVRKDVLRKMDASLVFIHSSAHPHAFSGLDFFSMFMPILNKNLVTIQENTIHIKRSLQ